MRVCCIHRERLHDITPSSIITPDARLNLGLAAPSSILIIEITPVQGRQVDEYNRRKNTDLEIKERGRRVNE